MIFVKFQTCEEGFVIVSDMQKECKNVMAY